jgi:signal transduction histidine kinase
VEAMIYAAIITFIIIACLLLRLFSLKKEVRKISRQLQAYNHRDTNKKVDLALLDKDIENLGCEINKLIDLYVTEQAKRIHFENEQKQAVANMSHDLRTPLTSIRGFIQMAEADDVPADEKKELLAIAHERAKKLEALLNDFFELSLIESQDHPLKCEHINLKNITINVLMSFYDRFNEKKKTPIIHLPDHDVYINADETAVTRVIENLVFNAITHSEGEILIRIVEHDASAGLVVENDAPFLAEEDMDRMFDRFYMADRSRSGKGTGLGLSIVKSFMVKMGGKVSGQLHKGRLSIVCEWETEKDKDKI